MIAGLFSDAPRKDETFVRLGADSRSMADIETASLAVASGMRRLGVHPGDRVAIICPNRLEMVELLFGCWALGAVAVPLNVFLKGAFLRSQLDDADPCLVVTDAPGYESLAEVADDVISAMTLVTLDEVEPAGAGRPRLVSYDEVRSSPPIDAACEDPSTLAAIMFTSGTTGRPKGCMLSHGYYRRAAAWLSEVMGLASTDVLSSPLPLYHFGGQGLFLSAIARGCSYVMEPEFRVTGQLERLVASGATVLAGVGAMGEALLRSPESDLDHAHSLRLAYLVPFSPTQHERFKARFDIDVTSALYGQTECVPVSCTALSVDRRQGTAGTVPDDLEVKLVDDAGDEVEDGAAGEVWVRPRTRFAMFDGYWRVDPPVRSPEKWHQTGDLARFDDGHLVFVDRKKDAIRRRGENVSSLEVEAALLDDVRLAEIAVFGVPSELSEEEIMAVCVPAPGVGISPQEFFELCAARLPYFAIPRYLELADQLPRNGVNRVMKHHLRERGVSDRTIDLGALGLTLERASRRRGPAPSNGDQDVRSERVRGAT